MSEYERARFLFGPRLDLVGEALGDAANSHSLTRHRLPHHRRCLATRKCSFSDHYDREMSSRAAARRDFVADLVYVVGNLRNQNHIGGAPLAGVESDGIWRG